MFGDPTSLGGACHSALVACAEVDRLIELLNIRLESELAEPLRVAMGLHCGPHVHGRVGVGDSMTMSVVGPAVNVASRLEFVAKDANVQLAVSAEVACLSGLDVDGLSVRPTAIRGTTLPMDVYLVTRARDLRSRLGSRGALRMNSWALKPALLRLGVAAKVIAMNQPSCAASRATALGGAAGSRLTGKFGLRTSRQTVLRELHRSDPRRRVRHALSELITG